MKPPPHVSAFDAMATTFAVVIDQADVDATYARQAADAVRREIERLEDELSRFRPSSDIWRLSQLKAGQRTRVGLAAWDCLSLAKAMHRETGGAFDITIGPLMRLWRGADGSPRQPHPDELEEARRITGSHLFELHEEDLGVTVLAAPMVFDLGALGKGYALDQAVDILHEWGIHQALLNAGDSTVLALAPPDGEEGWIITLDREETPELLLRETALSGTGFAIQGAHVMDPRTLEPVPPQSRRSYALAPTAALADALSTAMAVMSAEEAAGLAARHPAVRLL